MRIFKKTFSGLAPRVPMIKFLGKRSLLQSTPKSTPVENNKTTSSNTTSKSSLPYDCEVLTSLQWRPEIFEEEMEIINNGGISQYELNWNKITVKK